MGGIDCFGRMQAGARDEVHKVLCSKIVEWGFLSYHYDLLSCAQVKGTNPCLSITTAYCWGHVTRVFNLLQPQAETRIDVLYFSTEHPKIDQVF